MLTDEDRVIGHALAAECSSRAPPTPQVLAQHFELGERRADAARFHVIAAETHSLPWTLPGSQRHVASAETCAASGELLGAHVSPRRTCHSGTATTVRRGKTRATRCRWWNAATARWFDAAGIASVAFGKLDDTVEIFSVVEALEQTGRERIRAPGVRAPSRRIRAGIQLAYFGELARTDTLLDGCEREPGADGDAGVLAWLCDAAFDRMFASGEPVHPSRFLRGRELYERLGDRRGVVVQTSNHILALAMLGAFAEARAALPAFESESAETRIQIGEAHRTLDTGVLRARETATWLRSSSFSAQRGECYRRVAGLQASACRSRSSSCSTATSTRQPTRSRSACLRRSTLPPIAVCSSRCHP